MEKSEGIGLAIAATGHLALLGILSAPLLWPEDEKPISPTITVQLADEIGLEAATPNPSETASLSGAPDIGEPQEDASEALSPDNADIPDAAPTPSPTPAASPRPAPKKPKPPAAAPKPPAKPAPTPKKPRNTNFNEQFADGVGGNDPAPSQNDAPAKASAQQVAALNSIIANQIKPHWTAPTGADAELLVTRVSWSLSSNGSLTGTMSCRQVGKVTPSNRPQVDLHCERAKAAIKRAAPFSSLPDKFYDEWKSVVFNFDRRT